MNYQYIYTKNINRHLIHILDRNNRRKGVFGNNLMNISLYIWMNLLMNLCDYCGKSFVLCGTLYCLCFLVITLVKRSLWGEINFPPLPLGQREPGQRGPGHFNTKTIQHGPLCPLTYNGYIFHALISVNESS